MAFAQRSADDDRGSWLVVSIRPVATPLILDNAKHAEAKR